MVLGWNQLDTEALAVNPPRAGPPRWPLTPHVSKWFCSAARWRGAGRHLGAAGALVQPRPAGARPVEEWNRIRSVHGLSEKSGERPDHIHLDDQCQSRQHRGDPHHLDDARFHFSGGHRQLAVEVLTSSLPGTTASLSFQGSYSTAIASNAAWTVAFAP